MNWISVKDQLPEFDKEVLVYTKNKDFGISSRRNHESGMEWFQKYIINDDSEEIGIICFDTEAVCYWHPLEEPTME